MANLHGMRAHLRAVNQRGEVLIDEDVNRVAIDTMLRWESWEPGEKLTADRHEVSMADLAEVVLTPCSDRLKVDVE